MGLSSSTSTFSRPVGELGFQIFPVRRTGDVWPPTPKNRFSVGAEIQVSLDKQDLAS